MDDLEKKLLLKNVLETRSSYAFYFVKIQYHPVQNFSIKSGRYTKQSTLC